VTARELTLALVTISVASGLAQSKQKLDNSCRVEILPAKHSVELPSKNYSNVHSKAARDHGPSQIGHHRQAPEETRIAGKVKDFVYAYPKEFQRRLRNNSHHQTG
jgi:hypothetical protein